MGAERHLKLVPTRVDAEPGQIAREIAIEAPADLVFSYFTDPSRHVRWQGVEAELDPRPGGHLRVTFAPGYVAVGTYIEVEPPTRLVYTWGWEQEGSDVLPPGATTVEVELRPTERGTVVRVVHAGLPETMLQFHAHGWDEGLTELHATIGRGQLVNRTDRLYALVEELRAVAPQWRSAKWFAERFEVSSRTIERDLSALQQAGVPIYATPGRRGGYAIDVHHTLPPLNLSAAEVAAVATALAADTATPFTHAGRRALQKILAVLGEVDAEGVRELASRIRLFDHADGQSRPSAVVERAVVAQQVLDITYRDKTGEASTRAVEPVAVLGVRPHWYLWAWCRLRQEPRSFRLDRITDAVMTDEAVPDRGLDPADLELTELVGRGILGG